MKKALGGLMVALCLCLAGCAAHGQHTSQPVSASQSTPPTLGQHTASAETSAAEPTQSDGTVSEPTSDDAPTQSTDQAAAKPAAESTAPVMTGYLPRNDAIQIAMDAAKVSRADISDLSCELEEDDGVMIYQVEFEHGQYEYEYDIDAKTGKILDVEVDD